MEEMSIVHAAERAEVVATSSHATMGLSAVFVASINRANGEEGRLGPFLPYRVAKLHG